MTCGRSHQLDAWVAGELTPALEADLRSHVAGCTRCRHELNWLKTEAALVRLRAGRDEVAHLWKGVALRSGLRPPRRWPAALLAVAAAAGLVLLVGVLRPDTAPGPLVPSVLASTMSDAPAPGESVDPSEGRACSTLPEGLGFHCGPLEQASFVASR